MATTGCSRLNHYKNEIATDLSNKAVSMAATRYCYGVCADPNSSHQLASRGENVVCLWDTRHFDRPVLSLQHPRPLAVTHLQWCPTRLDSLPYWGSTGAQVLFKTTFSIKSELICVANHAMECKIFKAPRKTNALNVFLLTQTQPSSLATERFQVAPHPRHTAGQCGVEEKRARCGEPYTRY